MTTLIVDIENKEDLDVLIPLMNERKIHWRSSKIRTGTSYTPPSALDYDKFMQELNALGGKDNCSSFGDAAEYQREVRKDRKLPFRD
ncbi:hypothetical protein [Parasediminibacterium sp. JCM 36343]|uniref:hypothetical protein n=1 Tax=Parasediminibacterium sp. JCM 36343 TaxID=3374279 RepID=UPI00397AE51A